MGTIGLAILVVGLTLFLIGAVQLLVLAYQEHLLWVLGCLLIPILPLLFAALHWKKAKTPLAFYLGGFSAAVAGLWLTGQLPYYADLVSRNMFGFSLE